MEDEDFDDDDDGNDFNDDIQPKVKAKKKNSIYVIPTSE